MGVVVKADCPQCDYQEDFYLGAGMLFGSPDIVNQIFNKATAQRILDLRKSGKEQSFKAEYALAFCEKCNRLTSMPRAEIRFENGTREEFCSPCICGYSLKIIDDIKGKTALPCPLCGSNINLEEIGMWD